ncbi:MAG: SDR family oxidoreductase [Alphaproteobacteria bacterium]|nr:SDR family oxidoreductase [Alphaproteobacteria bacterium]
MKTAMITGCASGFGHALARRMIDLGYRVVATDPDPAALEDLASERTLRLALDVRDDAAVRRAVAEANAWSPVDILVNNGGYAIFGTQEEVGLDCVQAMFDVNVFGPARTTRALLPTLRERSGTVVQISSVAGRAVFPESGWYAATKYALEAMSEALLQECATFGVRVRLVEPGAFATNFQQRATLESPEPPVDSPYAAARVLWGRRKQAVLEAPQDPRLVVDAIVASLARPEAFERVIVGADSQRILTLREALGADAFSMLAARRNGLAVAHAPDGHVLLPAQVVAILDGPAPDVDRLEATLIAHHHGHLDHWADDGEPDGPRALALLDALFQRE